MEYLYTNSKKRKDSLEEKLLNIEQGDKVSIATPFFTCSKIIKKLIENKSEVELIVRLCEATSPKALKEILGLKGLKIKFYIEKTFHSKLYIVHNNLIIIGSSNLTNSGIKNNKEINIGILPDDLRYRELSNLFKEYWEEAFLLDDKILFEFTQINQAFNDEILHKKNHYNERIENLLERKARVLTEDHKKRIGESNIGKRKGKITLEHKEAMKKGAIESNSKPIRCLNTSMKYSSIREAAKKNGGTEFLIGEVCRGRRSHYKREVWRFEEDFIKLSKSEIKKLIQENKLKPKAKSITKFLYKGITYTSFKELGYKFVEDGFIVNEKARPEQNISQKVNEAKKKLCQFFPASSKTDDLYVYFAEYEQEILKNKIIEEHPVERGLKEIKEYYDNIFELEFEEFKDFTLIDLIRSSKEKFYEIDNNYYKSFKELKDREGYEEVITKEYCVKRLNTGNCKIYGDFTIEEVKKSSKKEYYKKREMIFKNKNDYINKNYNEINKNDIINYLL